MAVVSRPARRVARYVEAASAAGVIAAAVVLALAWVRLVPIFQAPDEQSHFDYAYSIASAGRLLRATEGPQADIANPDVRYLAEAADLNRLAFNANERVDPRYGTRAYFASIDRHAPTAGRAFFRRPGHPIPWLIVGYPFGYYALAAVAIGAASHVAGLTGTFFAARELSVVLLALSLTLTYLTLRELRQSTARALLLTAIVGCLPLTTFVASYVQPDNLAFTATALVFYAALRLKREPGMLRWTAMTGIALGLVALAKTHVYAALAVPIIGCALTARTRLPRPARAWAAAVAWLLVPGVLVNLFQYGFVHPVGSRLNSVTFGNMHADRLHAALAHGVGPGAAFFVDWTRRAFDDYIGPHGTTAASFWGDFGWLDTPLVVVNWQVEDVVRGVLSAATWCAIAGAVLAIVRYLVRVAAIGRRGRHASAARLLFAHPLYASYAIFAAMMVALYVTSTNGFGAQGRNWIAFLLPAMLVAVELAPRALRAPRAVRLLSAGAAGGLALYAAAGAYYASASVYDRYYVLHADARRFRTAASRWDGAYTEGYIDAIGTDSPRKLSAARPIVVRGWAMDRAARGPALGVDVEVDGGALFAAGYGTERPDVAHVFGAQYERTGFTVVIPPKALRPGVHRFTLRIITRDIVDYERVRDARTQTVGP